jgi:hypothetical protein
MAPSTTSSAQTIPYYNAISQVSGNKAFVAELSYHRYAGALSDLQAIGARASAEGIASVMGEKNGASVRELFEDLTIANVAAWEQGTMGFYKYDGWTDDGTAHYWTDYSTTPPTIELGVNSRPLRQYFNYVRRGAVRIGASSQDGGFRPVAFINANGKYVVVVWATKTGSFTIGGLPPRSTRVSWFQSRCPRQA